jgi:phenylacetate-CoA ligase
MGRRLGTPTLLVAGSPIDSAAWRSLADRVKNSVWGTRVVSSFSLTPERIEAIFAEIGRGRFHFIVAYASVFDILANHCRATSRRLRIPAVIPAAELVTQAQRTLWSETFGCEIFEIYGSREMITIAGEVHDHRGMVVTGDLYHVEVADDEGRSVPDGTPGLLTITSLTERSMPLFRYQLGDVGTVSPPTEGSPHPFERLSITHGRVLDVIVCPDGKLLPGEYFPHLIKEVQAQVRQYQVVQHTIDELTVRIVRSPEWRDESGEYLRERIRLQVGAGMRIALEFVDDIPTSASGKYRPTISHVPSGQKRFRAGNA